MENIKQPLALNKKKNFIIFSSIVAILGIAAIGYFVAWPKIKLSLDKAAQEKFRAAVAASDKYFNFRGTVSAIDKENQIITAEIGAVSSFAREFPQKLTAAKAFHFKYDDTTKVYMIEIPASVTEQEYFADPAKFKKFLTIDEIKPGILVQFFIPLAEGDKVDNFQISSIFLEEGSNIVPGAGVSR